MKITRFFFYITLIFSSIISSAQQSYLVPSEIATIQGAIDTASSGDTIIVSPGVYFENIDYSGKGIYLCSEFLYTNDWATVETTIIDGSQPLHQDTASVVRIVNGESADAVLRGFTIQGGNGTRTYNSADQNYFRTGGGISCDQSSPVIVDNIIRDNHCEVSSNVLGAGGGGVRVGFGQPYVARNTIVGNSGGYAGGIMIAYCEGMVLENNIIAYNHSEGNFGGGGGVYVDWEDIHIINNTIVHNSSSGTGGGLCLTGNSSEIRNCIIQNNSANSELTESIRLRFGGSPDVDYSNVGGGWAGTLNIDTDPLFLDTVIFELDALSPSVDTGDPDTLFNDIEDIDDPGLALHPAKGTIHNDMGAHGGHGYVPQSPTALFEINEQWGPNASVVKGGLQIVLDKPTKLRISVFEFGGKALYFSSEKTYGEGNSVIPFVGSGPLIIKIHDSIGRVASIRGYR